MPTGSLRSEAQEVVVAYEAQMRDLLFLDADPMAQRGAPPTNTAFDIVVRYRNSLACFEVKFLTGWKPEQLCQELKDCDVIRQAKGYSQCDLILLYPAWKIPSGLPPGVKLLRWGPIREICREFDGEQIVTWMESVKVPLRIRNDGSSSTNKHGLFDNPRGRLT